MVEVAGRLVDHVASVTIVLQYVAPGVVAVVAFIHRHPIRRVLGLRRDDE